MAARPRTPSPTSPSATSTSRPPRSTPMPQHGDGAAGLVDHLRGRAVRARRLQRDPLAGCRHRRRAARRRLAADRQPPGRRAAAHPAGDAGRRPGRPDRPDHPVVRVGRPRLVAGGCERQGADAVATARQVGLAGLDRQPDRVPRSQGQRRGAGQQRAQPEERRGPGRRRALGLSGHARCRDAARRPRREERRHRHRPAEGADRSRPVAARDQPAVGRSARVGRGDPRR